MMDAARRRESRLARQTDQMENKADRQKMCAEEKMAANAVYVVEENVTIARDVFRMRLAGPTAAFTAPGQFAEIGLEGFYLRRPISVHDWDEGWFDIIYKVVGEGTAQMAMLGKGSQLDVLVGLGNGYNLGAAAGKDVAIVGGGVGVPPLYRLVKELISLNITPKIAIGFVNNADVILVDEFQKLGCEVHLATDDGSAGEKGFVTSPLKKMTYQYYFASGPIPMLKAVHKAAAAAGAAGQLSLEERMGCGFGVCMGCTCETKNGYKRVCKEGPVFMSDELVWG